MIALRLLNPQGIAGLAAAAILGLLLIAANIDSRHFRKQATQFEQLYRGEAKAHASTIANYRIAAEQARADDRANAVRVRAVQTDINERTDHDFQARLAAARARAQRLRLPTQDAADPRGRGSASVSVLSAPARQPSEAAGQDRLSDPDRLIATEQAIQLDALINWVRAQAAVDPSAPVDE